jgi:hypothetical protein
MGIEYADYFEVLFLRGDSSARVGEDFVKCHDGALRKFWCLRTPDVKWWWVTINQLLL